MKAWLGGAALLAGMLGVPLVLLALGHGLRHRGRVGRGAFWGGVLGYGVGIIAWVVLAIGDATAWSLGSHREVTVLVLLLASGGLGASVGIARGWGSRG